MDGWSCKDEVLRQTIYGLTDKGEILMCIVNDNNAVVKKGQLKLWKVIRKDDIIGIWGETERGNIDCDKFVFGVNFAAKYSYHEGAFHCFFTRKEARHYRKHHQEATEYWPANNPMAKTKIIQVSANSSNVVSVGYDSIDKDVRAISVNKMEIKSLKHQR